MPCLLCCVRHKIKRLEEELHKRTCIVVDDSEFGMLCKAFFSCNIFCTFEFLKVDVALCIERIEHRMPNIQYMLCRQHILVVAYFTFLHQIATLCAVMHF